MAIGQVEVGDSVDDGLGGGGVAAGGVLVVAVGVALVGVVPAGVVPADAGALAARGRSTVLPVGTGAARG